MSYICSNVQFKKPYDVLLSTNLTWTKYFQYHLRCHIQTDFALNICYALKSLGVQAQSRKMNRSSLSFNCHACRTFINHAYNKQIAGKTCCIVIFYLDYYLFSAFISFTKVNAFKDNSKAATVKDIPFSFHDNVNVINIFAHIMHLLA